MSFSICTRATIKGSGWYFSDPTTKFKDVYIKENMLGFRHIYFTYNGKHHHSRLTHGRYGDYFSFGSMTYYVLKE